MFRTNDGQDITATEPAAIIRELHKLSFSPCINDRAFMRELAGRVQMQFDKRVRVDSEANFVADLIEIGLLIDIDQAAA